MSRSLLVLLPILIPSSGDPVPTERLVYAPEEGTVLVRTVRADGSFHLVSHEALLDGEEVESDPQEEATETFKRYVITDVIEELDEGRPRRLVRTFDKLLRGTMTPGSKDPERSPSARVCDLEGHNVLVVWDDGEGKYHFRAPEGDEIDEALLAPLAEDLDFRDFLPPDAVVEGDSWILPAEAGIRLGWNGGVMPFRSRGQELDSFFMGQELINVDSAQVTGSAVFGGTREENGRRLVVIDFELEISTGVDLVEEDDGEDWAEYHWSTDETWAHAGTLLWDLDRKHMHSLHSSWKGEMSIDMAWVWEEEGRERKQEDRTSHRGEGTLVVTVGDGPSPVRAPAPVPTEDKEERRFPSLAPFTGSRMWEVMFDETSEDFDFTQVIEMARGMYENQTHAEEVASKYGPERDDSGPSSLLESPMSDPEQAWWSIVPFLVLRLEPLVAKPEWTREELLQAEQTAAYLCVREDAPPFGLRKGQHAANVEQLWRIAAWFREQCRDPRRFSAMIFTFDDGPFVGLEHPTEELLEFVGQVSLNEQLELRLAKEPDQAEPFVLQCVREGELQWSRRISDSPDCTVGHVRFLDEEPTDLGEHGWKVHMRARWKYGSEYLHLYVDREGRFLFYFLSW